jgi:uncharacterized protein (TIGR02145 family)
MKAILFVLALLGAVVGRGQIVLDWYGAAAPVSTDTCGAFVSAGVFKKFLCHNLGANTAVVPTTPSWELIGNYYQWGRNPTCFGLDGVDATNPCSSPVYGAAAPFGNTTSNDNAGSITGWSTVAAATGSWGATKTADDPCPSGWRVPTQTEWSGVINTALNSRTFVGTFTASSTNYSSGVRFGNSLFLPAGGFRSDNNGSLGGRGSNGYYWASTNSGSNGQSIEFSSSATASIAYNPRLAFSVRCIEQ